MKGEASYADINENNNGCWYPCSAEREVRQLLATFRAVSLISVSIHAIPNISGLFYAALILVRVMRIGRALYGRAPRRPNSVGKRNTAMRPYALNKYSESQI